MLELVLTPVLLPPVPSRIDPPSSGASSNLLAGLTWQADANTALSIASGKARATLTQNSNPRIWKEVALAAGTYRYSGDLYAAGLGWRFRVSTTTGIPSGDIKEEIDSGDKALSDIFVMASPGTVFIGVVAITSVVSDFIEIQDSFSLTLEP